MCWIDTCDHIWKIINSFYINILYGISTLTVVLLMPENHTVYRGEVTLILLNTYNREDMSYVALTLSNQFWEKLRFKGVVNCTFSRFLCIRKVYPLEWKKRATICIMQYRQAQVHQSIYQCRETYHRARVWNSLQCTWLSIVQFSCLRVFNLVISILHPLLWALNTKSLSLQL